MAIEDPKGATGEALTRAYRNGKRYGGRGRRRRGRIAGPIVVICVVIAVLVTLDYWTNAGQVYWGVEVGSLALGGKTPGEARRALKERVAGPLEEIRLAAGPRVFTVPAERMGVDLDIAATVEEAYAVGREGGIVERLSDRIQAAWGTVLVAPKMDYEAEKIRAAVKDLAGKTNLKPLDASVYVDGLEVKVDAAREGYELDVAATTENLDLALKNLTGEAAMVGETSEPGVATNAAEQAAEKARKAMSGPIVLTAGGRRWTLSPAEVGETLDFARRGGGIRVGLNGARLEEALAEMHAALTVRPVEAEYVVNGSEVSVVPGKNGKSVQEKRLIDSMEAGIFEGRREYEVPVVTASPKLTTAEAKKMKPTTLLGQYRTDYTWDTDPGRRINMRLASDAISGTLVAPGDTFSYNAVTEPLDYDKAKVIKNGAVAYEDGGGLSQVSSTLYMAANLAGLEIVEGNPHYAELPYIRPGFDTTVWFGALDLRFENNTRGYILIQEWIDEDGFNYARIYGRPTGKEVTMTSEKVFDGTDREGKTTTRWVVYKTITQNGKVIFDGVFREVTYKELDPYEGPPPE